MSDDTITVATLKEHITYLEAEVERLRGERDETQRFFDNANEQWRLADEEAARLRRIEEAAREAVTCVGSMESHRDALRAALEEKL